MRKIRKNDTRTNQTVFAFACPCASCARDNECDCRQQQFNGVSWKVIHGQEANIKFGGSIVGGGG